MYQFPKNCLCVLFLHAFVVAHIEDDYVSTEVGGLVRLKKCRRGRKVGALE